MLASVYGLGLALTSILDLIFWADVGPENIEDTQIVRFGTKHRCPQCSQFLHQPKVSNLKCLGQGKSIDTGSHQKGLEQKIHILSVLGVLSQLKMLNLHC